MKEPIARKRNGKMRWLCVKDRMDCLAEEEGLHGTFNTSIRSVLLLSSWQMSPGTKRIVALSISAWATYSPIP
ncbi:hypothetical protein KY290_007810 [Solanum tuberosum]|uniref:Uncharacterized protein n=1 Tax=Solanum tuberosum TaxID=4113 RepID=A0ABQ7W8L6_SOLTU|nr:hypothetical protein KY290_007810 [Solanum tuberosum]